MRLSKERPAARGLCLAGCLAVVSCNSSGEGSFDPARGIVLHGTVVTMDAAGTILEQGNVLVRNGKIVAVWNGHIAPPVTAIGKAVHIDLGSNALIFPGLINLHNHSGSNALGLWPPPSSHKQQSEGRPNGTEPYANRYQWRVAPGYERLVKGPTARLNYSKEVEKYAEVKAVLGGETSFLGGTNNTLIRNVEKKNFDRDRIRDLSAVTPIGEFASEGRTDLLTEMKKGEVDAWLVHLAEGVRNSRRRPGDTFSSRDEFSVLRGQGLPPEPQLLNDTTVIVHGTGLELEDFVAMRAAPSIREDGNGDGLGAKLVWSPLSNLLLYGETALVYRALEAGVVVSLGTDWSPSGSRNLLGELKIADIALRDPRVLGSARDLIPALGLTGKPGRARAAAEIALDKLLVEMVTTNPARTLRWTQEVGSIEPGKFADLVLITKPMHSPTAGLPDSPYRTLIDATEEDVRLVLRDGEPFAGDPAIMGTLKPGDYETITSPRGCFQKAVDVTNATANQTFSIIETLLRNKLAESELIFELGEPVQLTPVFIQDDDFYFHFMEADVSRTGLIADQTPPFRLYAANFNHISSLGNPFAAQTYRQRYYNFCTDSRFDGRIHDEVRTKLALDPDLRGAGFEVAVKAGVVTLQGRVHTETARKKAVTLTRTIKGVVDVNNQLKLFSEK